MCSVEQMDTNTRIQRNIVRAMLYTVNTENPSQLDDLIHELSKYKDMLEANPHTIVEIGDESYISY